MLKKKSSARRESLIIFLAALIGVLVLVFLWHGPKRLNINGHVFNLKVANTQAERQKGLGGLARINPNQGMLFVFSSPAVECFWMKDVHFPIDIIWLNSSKTVNYLQTNVKPSSYPSSFCDPAPSLYTIELPAGSVVNTNLQIGQRLNV